MARVIARRASRHASWDSHLMAAIFAIVNDRIAEQNEGVLSVVVPCFNEEQTVKELLERVLNSHQPARHGLRSHECPHLSRARQ